MKIGIDVGGTNTGVGILDDGGNIIAEINRHTSNEKDFSEIAVDIINLIKQLLLEKKINLLEIKSIGIGLPGVVDAEKGVYFSASNLKVDRFPAKEVFEKEFNIPTFVDNDAKCAALAEAILGAAKEYNNSVTVTIGTGIGVGIIINKKIFRGINNSAGEFGHSTISIGGELCKCGRKGCWEQYASASALRKMASIAASHNHNSLINKLTGWENERINAKLVFDAAKQGDQVANEVLDKFTRNLSEGITNIVNILSPEVIVIGGGISRQGERITKPVKEFVKENMFCRGLAIPEIVPAKFEREAGIIGAAMLGSIG